MPTAHIRGSQVFLTECVWRKSCCQSVNMSKVQTLRAFVNQRLSAAAEEIFDVFERTIAEYEEELCRQHKLLDAVLKPEVRLHRADIELQSEWSSSPDQEDPPDLLLIKEEQEELWTSQEGEQLQGLEEDEIIKFPVKSEDDDEEKPQSSQIYRSQTEENGDDGDDYGGQEPIRNLNPYCPLQRDTPDKTPRPTELGTEESCDWEETRDPPAGSDSLQNDGVPVSDTVTKSSSECATSFDHKEHLQKHSGIQIGVKPFSCSVCGKRYNRKKFLMTHMRLHSEQRCFSCPVCKKTFQCRRNVVRHMRIHTGEKPFGCSVCGTGFAQKEHLRQHMRIHTGEKPFSCSFCGKEFTQSSTLTSHLRVHSGEKPFSCSVCNASFSIRNTLSKHMRLHTGEKPFSCSFCGKGFAQKGHLIRHLTLHTVGVVDMS